MADFARSTEPGRPGAARPAGEAVASRRPARARPHSRACSSGSAVRRIGCRPCSTSPAPTARARPAPSCAPRSKRAGVQRPRLHQPAPRPLQRAHPGRRAADRRRDARGACLPRSLDAGDGHRAELLRSRDGGRAARLRANAGRRLHPRGRARRPARRDQRHRASAGHRHRQPRARPPAVPRQRAARHRRRESGDRQARRAARHPALPARDRRRVGEVAQPAGAIWLPRGGEWDAIVSAGKLRYRDAQGALDLPLPRLPRAAPGDECRARHRHAPAPGPAARADARRSARRWAGPTGRRGCSISRRGRWSATRDVWLDGGHNPSAARQIAVLRRARASTTASRCTSSSQALRPRTRRACSSRSAASRAHVHAVPIPDHACFAPSDLVEIAGELGFPAEAHDSVAEALRRDSGRRAGADLRLALSRRRGARRQRSGPGLNRPAGFLVGMLGADVAAVLTTPALPIDWSIRPMRIMNQNSTMPGTAATVVSR